MKLITLESLVPENQRAIDYLVLPLEFGLLAIPLASRRRATGAAGTHWKPDLDDVMSDSREGAQRAGQ